MHPTPALLILALSLPLAAQGLGGQQVRLEALAARGQIQQDAPVRATSEITIQPSPQKVWRILTAVDDWPSWNSNVSAAHLNGPLAPGTKWTAFC